MACSVKKLTIFNVNGVFNVAKILRECGNDMYEKYRLTHWKNSSLKTILIVIYTMLGHNLYGVFDEEGNMVATFQTKAQSDALHFSKLAVSPKSAGRGLGTYCLGEMERLAKECGKAKLKCEVYDKSKHAYDFYVKRGFAETGKVETLKYTEIVLEKAL